MRAKRATKKKAPAVTALLAATAGPDGFRSASDIARMFDVQPQAIRVAAKEHRITSYRVGRRGLLRFKPAEVLEEFKRAAAKG